MQMESWRERGFVPDSDDEDGFDSQDRKKVNQDQDQETHHEAGSTVASSGEEEEVERAGSEIDGSNSKRRENARHDSLELVGETHYVVGALDDDDLPLPEGRPQTPEDESDLENESPAKSSAVGGASQTLTPQPKQQRDFWDVPSSSPDLLQLDHHPWRKEASPIFTPTPKAKAASQLCPPVEHVESSPLSSPLSSLNSLALYEDTQQEAEEPRNQVLEDLLPPLDIPEDILQALEELDQPARRSLRQRNPIQLHPYLLEDAKYQRLMKARGIRPVRVQNEQEAGPAAAESQGQDFGEDAGSTSETQQTDFHFPPSSPAEPRQLLGITPSESSAENGGRKNPPHPKPSTNGSGPRSPKRRRVAGPGDHRQHQNLRPVRPQVVINNVPLYIPPEATSIFDIPSPPRSGSVSSPPTQNNIGFRFPRGFSPPIITPKTDTRKRTKDVNDTSTVMVELGGGGLDQDSDDARSARSTSPHSPVTSDSEDENSANEGNNANVEEAAVRRLQKKIKGVLPASWLRLDQQKQQGLQSAAQQNRDRISRLETEAAKGVARKITKRADPSVPSRARDQLSSLRQLAEGSDQESERDDDEADDVEARQRLANMFGLEDSFLDQDPGGDIMEDNRIDYMFTPASRNHAPSHGRNPVKKRRRLDTDETRHGGQSKKPRLKRQARLTDPVYGSRRTKRPSQRHPKLGILDTPDVTSKPRDAQPQFLRVAARKARSRQDRGRQSPSHKVIRLSSRLDTEDANASLRDWRAGRMRQTTLPRPSSQKPRRRPLMDLSTNARDVSHGLAAKRSGENRRNDAQHATSTRNNRAMGENAPAPSNPNTTPETHKNAPAKPVRQSQQLRGNAWVVQRNLAITSLSRNNPRPVVPEIENREGMTRTSSLQGSLALLNRDRKLLLNRFLSGDTAPQNSPQIPIELDKSKHGPPKPAADSRRRQLKKRPPRRLDVTDLEEHAFPVFSSPEVETVKPPSREQVPHDRAAGGLNHFKTTYSLDFDISPLHPGVFFHESTFIGSGDFSRSLDISKRDLDKNTGTLNINLGDQSLRWGPWDDNVSSQLGVAFDGILGTAETGQTDGDLEGNIQDITDHGCAIYRSVIKYVTEALTFIDPIDRVGFATRANGLVSNLTEDLSNMRSATAHGTDQVIRIASLNVVFANQICQIVSHSLVSQSIRDEAFNLAKSASRQVIAFVSNPTGQAEIRKLLAASKLRDWREAGIKHDHPTVEAYVIVQHVLRSTDRPKGCLEDLLAEVYSMVAESLEKDIGGLENGWQRVFTTLPLHEIDALGVAHVGSRFKGGNDNWTVVKRLLRPALDSEGVDSESQPISYYSYCRVVFQRCFILINGWGWRDCKPILDTLYDFFAKRTLYNLKLEESYRSPSFLDDLDGNPSLEVLPGDSCFHILLKIIASGLRFLTKVYDKKKIRNYAWRLLPNHGRVYPKEQSIHEADLNALRNHHDLLCTLYSSVPDGCRPRLETIKNLVHPASSHRETCNISLGSWARLARFKLSTNEDVSGLVLFAEWHGYFVTEFLKQHSLARREVEAQTNGDKQFSQQLIDRTIAQNQRQIESLLKTALQGLQSAVKSAPTVEHAQKIVSETPLNSILGLFNTDVYRLNSTVSEALEVILLYVKKCNSTGTGSSTRTENVLIVTDEDSQDYGDWTDIEAVYGYNCVPVTPGVEHVEKAFHPAVSRLVSNCFGEDRCPNDAILLSVVDCWTSVAHTLVRHGLRRWDSYISPYEGDSWVALRSTTQTRKFTPQFLARCIEKDSQFLSDCKVQVFGMWLSSLVERVSMVKFQHRLTEALLNQDATDPVLKNLPFSRDLKEGRFSISFIDFIQRRLSLISSLLSNMRVHIQDLDDAESRELSTTQQEYREILQKMMSSMRSNYQELGGDENVQGAYVDFVQRIVGFLQQHTRDICPIEPFFTDTAAFPLPSNDPTYIVARLKSYEPKLSSTNGARTLTTFVQGVSERAALDGQQKYLVDQLYDSMAGSYEDGNPEQPTLRATLLQCVFPAYLATAFTKPAAWVLSRPIIETITQVFQVLLFNMDTTDSDCVNSVLRCFSAIFEPSHKALHSIISNTSMLKEPTVLITATTFLEMITSALPIVDYIDRLNIDLDTNATNLISQLRAFQQFTLVALSHLQPQPQQSPPPPAQITSPSPPNEITLSATRDLQSYINENWSRHQGKYYFTKRGGGHQRQEVEIEVSTAAKLDHFPERGFYHAAERFLEAIDDLDLFGEAEEGLGCENMSDLMWGEEIGVGSGSTGEDWLNEDFFVF
ncbi:Mus7/MMS22 family-domain-containing protein [Aspergillus cavernicola]|uniref:Mus7/MMS22 family-domain-containing protein n=1 Tax=Aspergillus cavernicola TaxID=176166 RepID=A0ABR4IBM0_9EURO